MSNSNGNGAITNSAMDGDRFDKLVLLTNALLASRAELTRALSDPRRDINAECGYPEHPTIQDYQNFYDREAIPARVVEVLPKESWQVQPSVFETEKDTTTEFEEAWDLLGSQLRGEGSYYKDDEGGMLWEYLCRADQLSGIGHYGIILLGIDDGRPLSEPATLITGSTGVAEDSATGGGGRKASGELHKLIYMRVFPESLAQITEVESSDSSPRFGQPIRYSVTFNDPNSGSEAAALGLSTATREVHWSRVIHIADNLGSSEVFGVPRMKPVYNRLYDLRKVYAADGEAFWRNAILKLFFETHPQLGGEVIVDKSSIKDQVEQMMNGLQQWMTLSGMSAKSIPPSVVDPSSHINVLIEAICIKLGIPVRVFKGSERGELASSQDDAAWNDRLRFRQRYYITPRIIVPVVDRLINLRVLPKPRGTEGRVIIDRSVTNRRPLVNKLSGGYSIYWPDLDSLTDQERTNIAAAKTSAMAQYVSSGMEAIYPPFHFLSKIWNHSEEEANAVLENAAEILEGKVASEIGGSTMLSSAAGLGAMTALFDKFKAGAFGEDTLRELIMTFFRVDEKKAKDIVAEGLPEAEEPPAAPIPPGMTPGASMPPNPNGGPNEGPPNQPPPSPPNPPAPPKPKPPNGPGRALAPSPNGTTAGGSTTNHRALRIRESAAIDWHTLVLDSNAFCPTGSGGGQDNSCPPKGGSKEGLSPLQKHLEAKKEEGEKQATSILAKFKATLDKTTDIPVLKQVKQAGQYMKGVTQRIFKGLEGRYGKVAAVAIMASGQAVGWGTMAVSTATTGVPLVLPGSSLWGAIPGVAVAETVLQAGRAAKKVASVFARNEELLGATFSQEIIEEEGRRVIEELKSEYLKYIKRLQGSNPEVFKLVGSPEGITNAFCKTGPGGGVDPSCAPDERGGAAGGKAGDKAVSEERRTKAIDKIDKEKEVDFQGTVRGGARGPYIKVPLKSDTSKETVDAVAATVASFNAKRKTEELDVDSLIATQSVVGKNSVKHMVKNTGKKGNEYLSEDIVVVRKDGKNYIHDGTHRASAAKFLGQKTIKATVYSLPEKGKK